ncbi:signal peptidase II [Sulfuriferula nivalis]|uniref:Lipoprotein signal peptidase n=1 Tax=Sulfuriferula nivalis TaxID=2675298 RepID=A0A809REM7_9PROT|nr:signal peptidase II [Sulfuriferula nivalis]BBP00065.1 lipoprotein signal peptidase [Sulfuriferula nivalis]
MPKLKQGLIVAALVIALDQISKYIILQVFMWGDLLKVTGFFDLVRAHNTGAAFSLFANQPGWQQGFFITVASIASIVIIYLLRRDTGSVLSKLSLSLILGGALGNLIDRLNHGYVVDFLSFHINSYYWPAFNIADSAITLGAIFLIWDSFKKP